MEHALRMALSRMAYLNVRERRLETRIAYVGPAGAGKATNLEQLGRRASPSPIEAERSVTDDAGEILAVEWGSVTNDRFRDCQLFARVVAPRGTVSAERARALLKDVDGVVLVVDATPTAREQNRAAAILVREALAAGSRKNVPVVVQINKTDADDALAPDEVASALGEQWPHVRAAAANGDGVVETLERALADVLARLQEERVDGTPDTVRPTGRAPAARTEGNPLLTALKEVLRETVAEHVAELEARFTAKLDAKLAAALTRAGESPETAELAALRKAVSTNVSETTRALAAHSGAIAALERKFLEEGELVVKVDALQAKVEALQAKADKLREEVCGEVVRVVEVQARADREHIATIATNLRRVVEQVSADVKDVKKDDLKPRLVEIDENLKKLGRKITEDVRDVVIAHVVGVEEIARASGEGITDVRLRMTELTDELKKKDKKGWFG
jgi:signal recognition particle receptor subunit beta